MCTASPHDSVTVLFIALHVCVHAAATLLPPQGDAGGGSERFLDPRWVFSVPDRVRGIRAFVFSLHRGSRGGDDLGPPGQVRGRRSELRF